VRRVSSPFRLARLWDERCRYGADRCAGSKGTPRVKQVSKPKSSALDDTKVQAALKKLPVQAITGIEVRAVRCQYAPLANEHVRATWLCAAN